MRLPSLFLAVTASLTLAGCAAVKGQARNVLIEKGGGVISVPVTDKINQERANREKAVALIVQKCGRNYEITREEEVEVGFEEETVVKNELPLNSNKKVVKVKKSDYRIWYRCR